MRICYIADAGSIHTQRWVKYFTDKGHDVHLISLRPFGDGNHDISLYVLRVFSPRIRIVSFLINQGYKCIQIRNWLRQIRPDVVHAHYVSEDGFIGALSGFHPFILSAWGSDVLVEPKKSLVSRKKVSFTLARADMITTTSELMVDYLRDEFSLPPDKIIRIPWGINLNVFHRNYKEDVKKLREGLDIDENSPVILSNRGTAPKYEINSIVDAIPHVLNSCAEAVFVILRGYGTEEYEYEMKARAEALGVIRNIRFVSEFVTPSEMAAYLNMAHSFVSVPKSDQFASSIQEGMACGAIPIVGDLEDYQQYLEDSKNAFFVNPDHPEHLAEIIVYCIEHPELKSRFYEINRAIIEEKEDWDKNAEKMEELYINLFQESKKGFR